MNIQSSTNLPAVLTAGKLPVVAAPLFIISVPDLVIAQCKAGVIGSFPALNAREKEGEPIELERWLKRITEELDRHNQENPDNPAAPFAVNQIVHRSNPRLMRDIEICVKWNVPVWITSLGARPEVNEAAHSCGGIVLHDIINNTFARKAIEKGSRRAYRGGGGCRRTCWTSITLCSYSRNQRMVQGALIAFWLHRNRTSFACFTHDGSRHGIHRFTIHCNKRGKCH